MAARSFDHVAPMHAQITERVPRQSPEPSGLRSQTPDGVERRLPIIGHLEELRRRLWICVGIVLAASLGSFSFTGWLVDWLKRPAGSALPQLAFFSPPEALVAYMKVAVMAGLVLSMPVVLYELWAFVQPGLNRKERRYGLAFIGWGSILFLAGCAFAYWVILPVSLQFLLGFGGGQLVPVISIGRYLSFTTAVILACGVVFQLPLAVFLLAKLGAIRPQTLRRQWRHAVVAIVVAAAILTPTTDAATMLLMVVPMAALYEVSIWIAAWAVRRKLPEA